MLNQRKLIFCWTLIFWTSGGWTQPTSNISNLAPLTGNSVLPKVESQLPKCQGQSPTGWNMCFGDFTFPNGNAYTGEWKNGRRDGVGTLRIVSKGPTNKNNIGSIVPSTYAGEFLQGQLSGRGVWIVDNGNRYEGEFVQNALISVRQYNITSFGTDSDKKRKKCESYGLNFGTGDFAQCMLLQERQSNEADQVKVINLQNAKAIEDSNKAELQRRFDDEQKRIAEVKNRESKCMFVKAQEYARPVLGGFFQSMQNANNAYDNCMAGIPQINTTCNRDALGTISCTSR